VTVTSEDVAKIPETDRMVIARWILERASLYQPSMILTVEQADAVRVVLQGVAVDLVDPLADDSTIGAAVAVVAKILGAQP
jgi:hypothetical protein